MERFFSISKVGDSPHEGLFLCARLNEYKDKYSELISSMEKKNYKNDNLGHGDHAFLFAGPPICRSSRDVSLDAF